MLVDNKQHHISRLYYDVPTAQSSHWQWGRRKENNMEKYLNEMVQGESGTVKKVLAEGKIKRRLFDMGVTPGAKMTFKKVAPLGDPIEFKIKGYDVCLRKEEAKNIIVE